jgi:hypothetical protein
MNHRKLLALLLIFSAAAVCSDKNQRPPVAFELTLATINDSENPNQYVFVLNGTSVFLSYLGLKSYLKKFPKGSIVKWSPGCMRDGLEPLLNSENEMKEFSNFLDSLGFKFNLIPSG